MLKGIVATQVSGRSEPDAITWTKTKNRAVQPDSRRARFLRFAAVKSTPTKTPTIRAEGAAQGLVPPITSNERSIG
jgi:hypothetical protein